MTRRRQRVLAALALLAATTPLVALPAGPAGAQAPAGRVSSVVDDDCDPATPRLINQMPPALLQLGFDSTKLVATGKGIIVAVVDSGVDAANVHFPRGSVLAGKDISGAGAPNGQIDIMGHGTAVAGEIAARLVARSQIEGLAPDATILPIRVYTDDPDNDETVDQNGKRIIRPNVTSIALGIQTAAQMGAKIINVSLSTNDPDIVLQNAVRYATGQGALVVASAGNRATSPDKTDSTRYPGAYPDALAVSAVDGTGVVTDDSIHGSYVDVAAPGTDILTTYFASGDCQLAEQNASTSYATAYVSAAAALIAQAHPDETPAQWRYRLEVTALRVRPDTRDDNAGWGVIQPYEALTFVSDGTAVGPPDPTAPSSDAPSPVAQQVDPVERVAADHTDRDQTLWLALGGVVAVLVLALVGLLRRDRKKKAPPPVRPPRKPAGVR